ncbi:hypothetical protein A9168_07515 [Macellibacteroides sp. HH-ZS]|nr:hypothetical protein A9168_07515 [Macellibacteroides sp. HH-ZS]
MEKMDDRSLFVSEALPGTQPGSTIRDIYEYLAQGRVLTTLDAVISNRTVCLTKYISVLRNQYGIGIKDQWIKISKKKKIKQYWLPK